jgi:hypothetical protein
MSEAICGPSQRRPVESVADIASLIRATSCISRQRISRIGPIEMVDPRRVRTVLAFAVAPMSSGLVAVMLALPFRAGAFLFEPSGRFEVAFIIALSAILGYPIAFVFGVPLYVFFRWRGWNGLLPYVIAGALLGLIPYFIYLLFGDYASGDMSAVFGRFSNTAPVYIPLGVVCGAVAGLVFWLIARPDRRLP